MQYSKTFSSITFSPENEKVRQEVNAWTRNSREFDGVIDFDAAVRDPNRPTQILPSFDRGDHLHINNAGNIAQGNAIPLKLFEGHNLMTSLARFQIVAQASAIRMKRRRTKFNMNFRNEMKSVPFLAAALSVLTITSNAWPQESTQPLTAGMNVERALGATDGHAYSAQLESGGAIIGQVDQKGIDLVVDIYDSDGKQIRRLDSPNGANGPEPIDFTALQTGTYKFVVHASDKNAALGSYRLKVDQILRPADNARRLAKQSYSNPALYNLWEASLTDPKAVDKFIATRNGKDPVLDVTPINVSEMRVTYVILGDADTERVVFNGGPEFGVVMRRLGKTNLFLGTQLVANDARFQYSFGLREVHHAGPNGEVEIAEIIPQGPWLLEMPNAPAQPYVKAKGDVPKGKTIQTTIKSTVLNEERQLSVYLPPNLDPKRPCNLLIVFDGVTYGGLPNQAQAEVPTPTILDNLISEKKIGPTIAVLVPNMGHRNRDLNGSKSFADFIAEELITWMRTHYAIRPGPESVVVAGSSAGGFTSTFCAFVHPEAIGNVLSQSGAYWITKDWQTVRVPYPRDTGMMIDEFKKSPRLPIRFYLEVGRYDRGAALLGSNRELRDVLQLKGYDVDYREFDGGHEYVSWRGSLPDGLISLLGTH